MWYVDPYQWIATSEWGRMPEDKSLETQTTPQAQLLATEKLETLQLAQNLSLQI